jgi:hypothetical protein
MSRFRVFCAVAAALAVLAALPASASDPTVGTLLVEIAKIRHLAVDGPQGAEKALRAAGFALPSLDHAKSLTEGDFVAIATSVGVRVTTTRPDARITPGQVDGLLIAFGADLADSGKQPPANPNGDGPPREDPNPGKGKSKGFYKSPTEPL